MTDGTMDVDHESFRYLSTVASNTVSRLGKYGFGCISPEITDFRSYVRFCLGPENIVNELSNDDGGETVRYYNVLFNSFEREIRI